MIDEVNVEHSFWRPHQDEEYPVDTIHASTKEEHHEDSIGVLDGTRQDILNVEPENYNNNYYDLSKSKERIVLPSSVSRVVKDDAVTKEDATVEGKELENICSNTVHNIDNEKYHNSTVAVPTTTTTVISTEIVSNKNNFLSTLLVAVAVADDIDINNAKSPTKYENSIGDLDGIKEEYSSHGNNFYDNEYGVFCDRSDVDNSPPLPPESFDNDIWALERYRSYDDGNNPIGNKTESSTTTTAPVFCMKLVSNDDNNDFNYDDVDKEILQFKFDDSTGESETIVFYDCYDDVSATQQEMRNYSIRKLDVDSIQV